MNNPSRWRNFPDHTNLNAIREYGWIPEPTLKEPKPTEMTFTSPDPETLAFLSKQKDKQINEINKPIKKTKKK